MTDEDLMKMEAVYAATPQGVWRRDESSRVVRSGDSRAIAASIPLSGSSPRPDSEAVADFIVFAHNYWPALVERLKFSESILRDMALDGMPVALIRRYREALTRIANLDPRASDPRREARRALADYPGPAEDEDEADRTAWEEFLAALPSFVASWLRQGAASFRELESVSDLTLRDIGMADWAIDKVYETLAAFGHPRADPAIGQPKTANST